MSWSGLENTFTKSDARDVIVQTFRWDEIRNKPTDIDEKIAQIAEMARLALIWPADGETRYLMIADTLRTVRNLLDDILIDPFESDIQTADVNENGNNKIYIEQNWDTDITDKPEGLDTMLETISKLAEKTKGATWLTKEKTLRDVKNTINRYLLQPIRGGAIVSDLES